VTNVLHRADKAESYYSCKLPALGGVVIPWRPAASSNPQSCFFTVGLLGAGTLVGFNIHRQLASLHASAADTDDGIGDDDDLLIKAGLRNLLSPEENMMAQKLQNACKVASDMEKCMNDLNVKSKLSVEELTENRARFLELEIEIGAIKKDLSEKTEERDAFKRMFEQDAQKTGKEYADLQSSLAAVLGDKEKIAVELQTTEEAIETLRAEQATANVRCDELAAQVKVLEQALPKSDPDAELAKLQAHIESVQAELSKVRDGKLNLEAELSKV